MKKAWIPAAMALACTAVWLALEPAPVVRPCASHADCTIGARCVGARCELPVFLLVADRPGRSDEMGGRCGDGVCELAAGECEGICPADCPDVPCSLPCALDGVCQQGEGANCPDCYPAGCNFDGLCTVGESSRCPDCSCGDGFCDTGGGECVDTCPADCPGTPCERTCDYDAACEAGESDACPDCSCGDGICQPAIEDCAICALDCGPCPSGCGDGVCDPDDPPGCEDCEPLDEGL